MGLFADSPQQPLVISLDIHRGTEGFGGNILYFTGMPLTGNDNLYTLCRKVNVRCQKKFSDSEEYAGRRRS
jgi:hypothetical protein